MASIKHLTEAAYMLPPCKLCSCTHMCMHAVQNVHTESSLVKYLYQASTRGHFQ